MLQIFKLTDELDQLTKELTLDPENVYTLEKYNMLLSEISKDADALIYIDDKDKQQQAQLKEMKETITIESNRGKEKKEQFKKIIAGMLKKNGVEKLQGILGSVTIREDEKKSVDIDFVEDEFVAYNIKITHKDLENFFLNKEDLDKFLNYCGYVGDLQKSFNLTDLPENHRAIVTEPFTTIRINKKRTK